MSVVEVLIPGLSVSSEIAKAPCHPLGGVAWSAKLDAGQLEGSLFVTETVEVTAVPARTAWFCEGEMATLGLACTQAGAAKFTDTTAPVLLTETGVIVTPESGS